jgi:hypothetical protein
LLAPVLERLQLELVSWTRRGYDTVRREPGAVLARICDGLGAGDILLLHDGHAARTARGAGGTRRPACAARAHRRCRPAPTTLADALPEPREAATGSFAAATQ